MAVLDVALRLNMSRYRVYQLSRKRPRRHPILKRLYISQHRFEITMASVSAYEASVGSMNDEQDRAYRPSQPLDFRRGVLA